MKIMIILGPPGSGKGTLGKSLESSQNYEHFSMGDAFREIDPSTPLGISHSEIASRGELVSDEITVRIFEEAIQRKHDGTKLVLVDGFPKTSFQADFLKAKFDIRGLIHLEIEDDVELLRRIQQRALNSGRPLDFDKELNTKRIRRHRQTIAEALNWFSDFPTIRLCADRVPDLVEKEYLDAISHGNFDD